MPLVELRLGRKPFELAVLSTAALSGISGLIFTEARSPVVQEIFRSPALVAAWYAILSIGALVALTGTLLRDIEIGFHVERVGLAVLGCACPVYAIAALASVGWAALTAAAGVGVAYGGACWWRVAQITRDLPKVHVERSALRHAKREAKREDGDGGNVDR